MTRALLLEYIPRGIISVKYHFSLVLCIALLVQCRTAQVEQDSTDISKFGLLLSEAGMVYQQPAGFIPKKVVPNPHCKYDIALRHVSLKYEIRYTVFPLKEMLEKYRDSRGKKNIVLVDPNNMFPAFTYAIISNISSDQKLLGSTKFKDDDVKREFGADVGMSILLNAKESFGGGYKFVLVTALHRKDFADAYMFHLFDDYSAVKDQYFISFYSMKFK